MKFFGDLNVVASAIVGSIRTLAGTLTLMLLMIYIVAIAFTLLSTSQRLSTDEGSDELEKWYGSLSKSVLTLYESVLGGIDWHDAEVPLLGISWFLGLSFTMYIAFAVLAMLNVITGIFMQSALAQAGKTSAKAFDACVRQIFLMSDQDHDGTISREEFEAELSHPGLQKYLKEFGIDPRDTLMLFEFLDSDGGGSIDGEEFLAGMVRLRSGAKCIDLMTLMHDFEDHQDVMDKGIDGIQKSVFRISSQLAALDKHLDRQDQVEELLLRNEEAMLKNEEALLKNSDHARRNSEVVIDMPLDKMGAIVQTPPTKPPWERVQPEQNGLPSALIDSQVHSSTPNVPKTPPTKTEGVAKTPPTKIFIGASNDPNKADTVTNLHLNKTVSTGSARDNLESLGRYFENELPTLTNFIKDRFGLPVHSWQQLVDYVMDEISANPLWASGNFTLAAVLIELRQKL